MGYEFLYIIDIYTLLVFPILVLAELLALVFLYELVVLLCLAELVALLSLDELVIYSA